MSDKKRYRQESALKRTEESLLKWEQELKSNKDDDFTKLIKKKIERTKTTVENTKKNMR
tara:strand:+ start:424 stop:600 length:177 start_codon:yes stop_codon:yes gene_type:complete